MESAPYFDSIAEGPADGAAYWLTAQDGVRLRLGVWPEGTEGTVLLFPGRTEYIEKYAPAAEAYRQRGFASIAVDWRGQGLADRLLDDPLVGHVRRFDDYQFDVAAVLKAVKALNLPEPYYMIGHSMGGCIGLRALHNGLPVTAAAFSGPMWGIQIPAYKRPFAHALCGSAVMFGFSHQFAPDTTGPNIYVLTDPFEGNKLTHDREMWDFMKMQAKAHPEMQIGGPSLNWLREALAECAALLRMPAPQIPAITLLGDGEIIVSKPAIHTHMARWPGGELVILDECRHEPMMEGPHLRERVFDSTSAFFRNHAARQKTA